MKYDELPRLGRKDSKNLPQRLKQKVKRDAKQKRCDEGLKRTQTYRLGIECPYQVK
jgi:hypothetical protein